MLAWRSRAAWIGFCGLFLGIGLGGKRYRPFEMFLLMIGMLMAVVFGWWLFNTPHDPENQRLPFLLFFRPLALGTWG